MPQTALTISAHAILRVTTHVQTAMHTPMHCNNISLDLFI